MLAECEDASPESERGASMSAELGEDGGEEGWEITAHCCGREDEEKREVRYESHS